MRRPALAGAALAALLAALPAAGEDAAEVLVAAAPRPAPEVPLPETIRRLVAEGREAGDPRLIGRAEVLLAGALAAAPQDPGLRALRAAVRHWDHDFAGALEDYAFVLALRPADAQARIARAFLLATTGDPAAAAAECRALRPTVATLARAACHARAAGLAGKAREARTLLAGALAAAPGAPAEMRSWALTVLADLSDRLGEPARAAAEASEALALVPGSVRLRVRLAAFRLEAGEAAAALDALGDAGTDEALLLRAEALAALGRPAAEVLAALGDRLDAARRDGVLRHRRIEAEWLRLSGGDVRAGLALALANWEVSKEPEDLRTVLRLAAAAGDPAAAAPALSHRARTGLEDAVADRLAAALPAEGRP